MTPFLAQAWPNVPFPDLVVSALIVGSLILTGLGACLLVLLLIRDKRNKEIW